MEYALMAQLVETNWEAKAHMNVQRHVGPMVTLPCLNREHATALKDQLDGTSFECIVCCYVYMPHGKRVAVPLVEIERACKQLKADSKP